MWIRRRNGGVGDDEVCAGEIGLIVPAKLEGNFQTVQFAQAGGQLASGLQVKVPVALLLEYEQPQPAPAAGVVDRIKKLVEDLNAEDWKKRDRAEEGLKAMGSVAIGVLKQLGPSQPPEAQQRINSIVKELEKQQDKNTSAPKPGVGPEPVEVPIDIEVNN